MIDTRLRRTALLPALLLVGILASVVWTQVAQAKKPTPYSKPSHSSSLTITDFSPTSGPVGTTVIISGSGFSSTRSVSFNGASAPFSVASDTELSATVPAGATSGPITVSIRRASASSPTSFTVTATQPTPSPSPSPPPPPPSISGFSPTSGPVGTSVTISGTNFTGATAVTFGGTAATTFTVVSSGQITATVPSGAASGAVAVTTPAGTGTSSSSFSVSTTSSTLSALFVAPNGSDTTGDGSISKPFATLAKAQATMRLGGPQITYIRGGYYQLPSILYNNVTYGLYLTSADSGQTYSYYPPDGYNSAILDGGSTSAGTGIEELITINGASNVTIDGLQLQHFRWTGIAVHGGGGFYELFPNGTGSASGNTIRNNLIHDGAYDKSPIFGYGGGGIYSEGNVPGTTVANNAVYNIATSGIEFSAGNSVQGGNLGSLRIASNAVLSTCQLVSDCGSIYVQDTNATSTNITVDNNFVRDSGTASYPARSIYLDDGVSGAAVTNNVSTGAFMWAFTIHGGSDNSITSNIVDLGANNKQEILVYQGDGLTGMTGNSVTGNVIVSGGGSGWYEGSSFGAQPTIKNNAYHQYAGTPVYTGGLNGLTGDTSPVQVDPQLSCWTYVLSGSSPVYASPVLFDPLGRGWGPPGYTVPATGTPPSQPAGC